MQQAGADRADQRAGAIGEKNDRNCRRQRKACPRRQRAEIAGAHQADGKADLARSRTRQKLAQRHEVDIGLLVEPFAADDELFAEIAEMRDRATKARQPQPQENQQDFGRGAAAAVRSDCRTAML